VADYTFYYWHIPFRGQFVRAVLARVGASWDEADVDALTSLWRAEPREQPVPFMAVPVLTDHRENLSVSQMSAILVYLGRRHGLTPADPRREALTAKVVADASDVLFEATRHHGAQLWGAQAWAAFRPRLKRWMEIFEETGRRFGLEAGAGQFLGTEAPGVADLATCMLWGTMTDRFPSLRPMLDEAAPAVAGLVDRIAARPEQVALRERGDAAWGEAWCGGEIEASLREVL
jgi:glutathione S-transferase